MKEKETCELVGQNNLLGKVKFLTFCCSKRKIELMEEKDRLASFQNGKGLRTQTLRWHVGENEISGIEYWC